jgi:ribosomal protein S12 methylthiotransferase
MSHGGGEKVFFISLGCAKNLVDSEHMMGRLARAGYAISTDISDSSVAVINTCGFIEPAVEESIDTILEVARRRGQHGIRRIIVAGCLVQRYGYKLQREIPEVDCWIGTSHFSSILEAVEGTEEGERKNFFIGEPNGRYFCEEPRLRATPFYTAYLKIAEGCSHRCTYCTIPAIRGPLRSRGMGELVSEAARLRDAGVREINLIAQDTTDYGRDLQGRPRLEDLLEALLEVQDIPWIRILYSNPAGITERLLRLMEEEERICPYLDIPIQHVNSGLLEAMGRPYGRDELLELVQRIRALKRQISLRTTVMVGFPGESRKMYRELIDFIRDARFEHLGAFAYSPEKGTASERMRARVSRAASSRRLREVMSLQREISLEINRGLVGKVIKVLLEGASDETELLLKGRTASMAPDVDTHVLINKGSGNLGEFVDVLITEAHPYHLIGEIRGAGDA